MSDDRTGDYLPPADDRAFWREVWLVAGGCAAFVLVLAVVVTMTQGIVISLR